MSPEEKKRQIDMANGFYGFNRHNEIQIVDVDDGTSVIEVPLRKESNNPLGIAHGGLIFSICDVAAGVAARSGGRNTVSQDASIYFLSPGVNTTKSVRVDVPALRSRRCSQTTARWLPRRR